MKRNVLKVSLLLVVSIVLLSFLSCATGVNQYGHPSDSVTVLPSDAIYSGGLAIPVTVSAVRNFEPSYTEDDFRALVNDLDGDYHNYSYYIPAFDENVTVMARRFAYLSISFVFAEKTVGYSVTSLKRLARQRMAVNATEEELEALDKKIKAEEEAILLADKESKKGKKSKKDKDSEESTALITEELDFAPITESELALLTELKLDELSEVEKAIFREARINNALAGAGITALVGQSLLFATDIAALIGNIAADLAGRDFLSTVTLIASSRTLKEMKKSSDIIKVVRPKLDRNLNASRTVIDALYGDK